MRTIVRQHDDPATVVDVSPNRLLPLWLYFVFLLWGTLAFVSTGLGGDQHSPAVLRTGFFGSPTMLIIWLIVMLIALQIAMVTKFARTDGKSTSMLERVSQIGYTVVLFALAVLVFQYRTSLIALFQHRNDPQSRAVYGHWGILLIHAVLYFAFVIGAVRDVASPRDLRQPEWGLGRWSEAIVSLFVGCVSILMVALLATIVSAWLTDTNLFALIGRAFSPTAETPASTSTCVPAISPCESSGWLNWIIFDVVAAGGCFVLGGATLAIVEFVEGVRGGPEGQQQYQQALGVRIRELWPQFWQAMRRFLRRFFWPIVALIALGCAVGGAYFIQQYLQLLRAQLEAIPLVPLGNDLRWLNTLQGNDWLYLGFAVFLSVSSFFVMMGAVALQVGYSRRTSVIDIASWRTSLTQTGRILFRPFFWFSLVLGVLNLLWMAIAHKVNGGAVPQPFFPFGVSTILAYVGYKITDRLNHGAGAKLSGAAR